MSAEGTCQGAWADVTDDPEGGRREWSADEFERAVRSEAERREQSRIAQSLQAAQRALEERIATMSREVQERLQVMHDEWATQGRDLSENYQRLNDEWEERRRQFRLSALSEPQAAKLADIILWWDKYEPIIRARTERDMSQSFVEQRHAATTGAVAKHAAILGSIATATTAAIGGIISLIVWIHNHWH